MDKAELRQAILDDETLSIFVTKGDDGAIAEALNAKTIDAVRPIDRDAFMLWAGKSKFRALIQDLSINMESDLRSHALYFLDYIRFGNNSLDLENPIISTLLTEWKQKDKIDTATYEELVKLATVKVSLAYQIGKREVQIQEIAQSLRG